MIAPGSETPPVLRDESFRLGKVDFPNDTIYTRANVGVESNARLRTFLEKCETQDVVRIGFIGGSITASAGATAPIYGFSSRLVSFIKEGFPNLKSVVEINAGIGATGSRYGVSRVVPDLLSRAPDLIVIEFAVNDFIGGTEDEIRATIEGLVRQCLLYPAQVPVMMLFTAKGDGQNVQALHAEIGAHYGLPMISYRDAIWPLIDSGRIAWGDVFRDDPHPNNNGHRLAAHLLYTYLKRAALSPQGHTGGVEPPVPAPLVTDLYQYAGVTTATDSSVRAQPVGWKAITRSNGRVAYKTTGSSTSTLTLTTTRRELTLGIHMHPKRNSQVRITDGAAIDFTVNDNGPIEYTQFIKVFAADTATLRTIRVEHTGGRVFTLDYVLYVGPPE